MIEFDINRINDANIVVESSIGEPVEQLTVFNTRYCKTLCAVVGGVLWRFDSNGGPWDSKHDISLHMKTKTHTVNGVEVPDLRFQPKTDELYYYPDPVNEYFFGLTRMDKTFECDNHRLQYNLCYEYTEDGKQAAIAHAKAWMGPSPAHQ